MKRLLVLGVLLIIGAFVVDAIGDATQTRDDERHNDKQTEVVFHVEGKNFRQSLDTAAQALWGKCAATVGGHLVEPRHRADRPRRLPIRDDAVARRSRQGAAARMHERLVDRPVAVERRVGRTTFPSAPRPDAAP